MGFLWHWRHDVTDRSSKCATIKAAGDHVESARRALTQLLDNEEQRLSDPLEILQSHGVPAYLQALAAQPVCLPSYWMAHHHGADLKDCSNSKLVDHIVNVI